jgi:methylenetetrahydrofolate reductase (NADPH)
LLEAGLSEFHFYTLNRPEVSLAVCRALGLTPEIAAESAA